MGVGVTGIHDEAADKADVADDRDDVEDDRGGVAEGRVEGADERADAVRNERGVAEDVAKAGVLVEIRAELAGNERTLLSLRASGADVWTRGSVVRGVYSLIALESPATAFFLAIFLGSSTSSLTGTWKSRSVCRNKSSHATEFAKPSARRNLRTQGLRWS